MQLFQMLQYVYYRMNYTAITTYGEINFYLVQPTNDNPLHAFHLAADEVTVEATVYPYTLAGLSAKLL